MKVECVYVTQSTKYFQSTSESATMQLTPSSVNVCPGELVAVKCTISDAELTYTRWTISLKSTLHEEWILTLSDIMNISQAIDYTSLTNFRAEWTSFSPLCSTFMTNATAALVGAIVKCSHTSSVTKSLTITTRGIN